MLEFYYGFLEKHFMRQDFELFYMDTDSFYLAMDGDPLEEIVKPERRQAYEAEKKNRTFLYFLIDIFIKYFSTHDMMF